MLTNTFKNAALSLALLNFSGLDNCHAAEPVLDNFSDANFANQAVVSETSLLQPKGSLKGYKINDDLTVITTGNYYNYIPAISALIGFCALTATSKILQTKNSNDQNISKQNIYHGLAGALVSFAVANTAFVPEEQIEFQTSEVRVVSTSDPYFESTHIKGVEHKKGPFYDQLIMIKELPIPMQVKTKIPYHTGENASAHFYINSDKEIIAGELYKL